MQLQIGQATEVLAQTPAVLRALLQNKSAAWLHCRATPYSFSPIDVLGHLIHGELTDWIPRVRIVLECGETRPFEPFDRFAFQPHIAGKQVEDLLDRFAQLRLQSLEALRALAVSERQLDLRGAHPELGPVTLSHLLAAWAVHDLSHIAQIATTMAREYRDAVGPWKAYIGILA